MVLALLHVATKTNQANSAFFERMRNLRLLPSGSILVLSLDIHAAVIKGFTYAWLEEGPSASN